MKKTFLIFLAAAFAVILTVRLSLAADSGAPAQMTFDAPNDMKVAVKMIGPYAQDTDLQIICVFKHKSDGDTYVAAMKDLDDKVGGLLSTLRNRREFVGELGETILFNPPAGSIVPPRLLVIGLGPESDLSLETLRLVGRAALREAVSLKAKHVSFAPTIRDQGNVALDVGQGDKAVIENVILAYDTEKRLQQQNLAEKFGIADWTIEAGPAFFDSVVKQVSEGIESMTAVLVQRNAAPYSSAKKQ
jgi:hypothetical protein